MSTRLVLLGIVLAATSGIPGLLWNRHCRSGQWMSALLAVLAGEFGLAGLGVFWNTGDGEPIMLPWSLPGAEFHVAVDGLSAIFLLPIFLISLLGSVYGLEYWKQTEHPYNGRKLRLSYGTLTAGMALLVIARNSVLFLFGWEIMALSAYFLVTTEDQEREAREAGWIYLAASHAATLCLFALFALLRAANGSFALVPAPEDSLTPGMANAIFVLAVIGFGSKAGIMPLHVWLPSAHAIAPSHVSAILSAVLIKMGIYGLVRITSLLPNPPLQWGSVLLVLGVVSGVLGVAFAIGQRDLKRLLAYCSIENIGIIVIGLGLALIGRSMDRADWVILGLAGALLHVWNHSLFKSLLFFSAGSVIHAGGTRDIDLLGGLAKRMPWTALAFLIGGVAICGLPPLNGFISEFLIYLGLFGTLGGGGRSSFAVVAFTAPALGLIGALAAACFVKAYGVVFLGTSRDRKGAEAHESSWLLIGSMGVLAACCFFIGIFPIMIVPILGEGVFAWSSELRNAGPHLAALAPLDWITVMALTLIAVLFAVTVVLRGRLRSSAVEEDATWGCGYVAPTPRMQYTASSFAQMLMGLFGWALRPRLHGPGNLPLFPAKAAFHSEVADTVLDGAVLPAFRAGAKLFSWFRVFQGGSVQTYLLYLFIALITLLLWR
jgi:hydrogenase-4 component B